MPTAPQASGSPAGRWPDREAQASARTASSSTRRAGRREEPPTAGVGEAARPGRSFRSGAGSGASPTSTPGQPRKKPLYSRLLRLSHISPNIWQRALLGEGALAVGIVLVLADLATAWTILVLPLAVAAVVKAHDLLAGLLQRPARVSPPKAPKARRTKGEPGEPEPKPAGRTRRSRRATGVAAPVPDDDAPQEWPADDDGAPQEWPADDDGAGPPQGSAPAERWRKT